MISRPSTFKEAINFFADSRERPQTKIFLIPGRTKSIASM